MLPLAQREVVFDGPSPCEARAAESADESFLVVAVAPAEAALRGLGVGSGLGSGFGRGFVRGLMEGSESEFHRCWSVWDRDGRASK